MSSILTNNGAMVALETLRNINKSLTSVQSEISTGKKVATAKDNAAIWAISTVMSSDVDSFKQISDSLNLGSSTVGVARSASEQVTKMLTDMKALIVSAQESNVDRSKIQTDISALRDQIGSIVGGAQFNGLNLLDGSNTSVNVLASLNRSASGDVTVSNIAVAAQNLSTGGYVAKAAFASATNGTVSTDGDTLVSSLDNGGGTDDFVINSGVTFAAGDKISLRIGDKSASYTLTASDVSGAVNTPADLAAVGLKQAVEALGIAGLTVEYDSGTPGQLTLTNNGTSDLSVTGQFTNAGSGGLGALASIDVTTGAAAALASIDDLLGTAIDAAASFGSSQKRIANQSEFVNTLVDSLKTGIGGLTDADMEAASAKLQALQVQQQLGTQALSIANQAPQSLLALFR